jgi:hypothetical protein
VTRDQLEAAIRRELSKTAACATSDGPHKLTARMNQAVDTLLAAVDGYVLAFGSGIWEITAIALGHHMTWGDQITWVLIVMVWAGIAWMKDRTIATRQEIVRLREAREDMRRKAWLS